MPITTTQFTYYPFSNNDNENNKKNKTSPDIDDNSGVVIDDYKGVLNIFYPYLI